MKKFFGKLIDASKLQARVFRSPKSYQLQMATRGNKYSKKSTVLIKKCYICNTKKSEFVVKVFGSSYVSCSNCSHVFLEKRLSNDLLAKFYSENKSYSQTYTDIKQIKYRQEQVARPKAEFALKQIKTTSIKKRWLDVGCAIGDLVDVVNHKKGWAAKGIDISRDSIVTGKKIFKGDLQTISMSNFFSENNQATFGVISFFGYLGLIGNPIEELMLAHKHITKGGYIVIGEENADSVTTQIQKSYPSLTTRHLIPPNAIHMFTPRSIELALENCGFKIQAIWFFGLDFTELLKCWSLVDSKLESTPIFDFMMRHSNEFQRVCDSLEKSDYMVVVAKKI